MLFKTLLWGLLYQTIHVAAINPKTLADLFDVDSATCSSSQQTSLGTFVTEAANMARDGLNTYITAINGANDPNARFARAYLTGIMKIPEASMTLANTGTQQAILQRTYDLLWGGVQPTGIKAIILCSDANFVRKQASDTAMDVNNMPVKDVDGNPMNIGQVYATAIQAATGNSRPPHIYYLESIRRYFFLAAATVASDANPICGRPGRGGGGETFYTETYAQKPVIVLCPTSFTNGAVQTLGQGTLTPRNPGKRGASSLDAVLPSSLTLLHELYHFAPRRGPNNIETGDPAYFLERVLTVTDPAVAAVNPDSYSYLSLASWFTYNMPVSGNRIYFPDGQCLYLLAPQ